MIFDKFVVRTGFKTLCIILISVPRTAVKALGVDLLFTIDPELFFNRIIASIGGAQANFMSITILRVSYFEFAISTAKTTSLSIFLEKCIIRAVVNTAMIKAVHGTKLNAHIFLNEVFAIISAFAILIDKVRAPIDLLDVHVLFSINENLYFKEILPPPFL